MNEKIDMGHTHSTEYSEEHDSIIILFDNKLEQQRIDRKKKVRDIDSLAQSLYDERLVLKSKDMTIEEQVVELKKTLRELNDKNKLAEEQSKIAQEMKNRAELHRIEALTAKEESVRMVSQLKEENAKIEREVNELKKECMRLNMLLGNDYNVNEIDSIVGLPDSLKLEPKKTKNKKRNKKRH